MPLQYGMAVFDQMGLLFDARCVGALGKLGSVSFGDIPVTITLPSQDLNLRQSCVCNDMRMQSDNLP